MTTVFAEDFPDLMQTHLDHLKASAISDDTITARGYKSVLGRKELETLGFSKAQRRTPGLLIPLFAPDGSPAGHQYRPDNPREDSKSKPIKYETPLGAGVRLDMPPVCAKDAGNPNAELWITEGAKKADALASTGLCSLNLCGVWGFKGKNEFGSNTLLADFDLIALKGRHVYVIFDSDITTKPQVHKAMLRLKEHLERKEAVVHIIQLPPGKDDTKTGVDDYLAAGHTARDLHNLPEITPEDEYTGLKLQNTIYRVEDGRFCIVKNSNDERGKALFPLCNFVSRINEEVIIDDGIEESRKFVISGSLDGKSLPEIEVPASSFNSMDWVSKQWGARAIIGAGSTNKDHLRAAIQLLSNLNGSKPRRIYAHTGWRTDGDERFYIHGSGALGKEGIEVDLRDSLARYRLPSDLDREDIAGAMRTSLDFLDICSHEVSYSLWASMYLSPLAEILEPAFTLWLLGRTGSLKSTICAQALCHFGDFDWQHLPASWEDTANALGRYMAILKDHPLVIDDFRPATSTSGSRENEVLVEKVIRAQGNKAGRGRLSSDTSFRKKYIPQGMVITSGEQLPSSESGASRLFVVEVEKDDIDRDLLTAAQERKNLYGYAMAGYICWLQADWDILVSSLKNEWKIQRNKAISRGIHLRLPAAVAWLFIGFKMAVTYASEIGAIDYNEGLDLCDRAWEIFINLADRQGARVDEQRPALRFLESLGTLLTQQRVFLIEKSQHEPLEKRTGQQFVGWKDDDYIYLDSKAAHSEVYEFCHRGGDPFTWKRQAVWADLRRLGFLVCNDNEENSDSTRVVKVGTGIDSRSVRVIQLKRSSLQERVPIQQKLEGV